MLGALRQAGNPEIGGVLMGEQIGPSEFRIVDLSIDDVSGSAANFVRSVDQHRQALAAFFDRTSNDYARYNYLGGGIPTRAIQLAPAPKTSPQLIASWIASAISASRCW